MPVEKLSLSVDAKIAGSRLDHFLAVEIPRLTGKSLSKAKVRKLIVAGAVYLNGKRVRIASKQVQARARIQIYIDWKKLEQSSQDRFFEMTSHHILFEDEDLIAIDKPPGLPAQQTLDEARDNLASAVKKFLSTRDQISQPYLGLHHRLDRDTSGVMLFTKTTRANAELGAAFQNRMAKKVYQALAFSRTPSREKGQSWSVENHLAKMQLSGKKSRFHSVRSGGDYARTDFLVLESLDDALWIEARPLTGRTHQIRVQLAEGGDPILGDRNYGGPEEIGGIRLSRTMLHAASLTFPHPIHKNEISVISPLPEDFLLCLRGLQARKR